MGNDKNDVMSFRTVLRKIWLFPVYLYKKVLSPLLPDACRYSPSCSSYMVQSVQKHGILKGTFLGINRILRCSALFTGGEDPVPEKFSIKGTFALYAKFWDGKKKHEENED